MKKRKIGWGIFFLLCLGLIGFFSFRLYGEKQMEKIPSMSLQEVLVSSLKGNKEGKITLGIYDQGKIDIRMFGQDGKEIPYKKHRYEIGSISKTLTGLMIKKAEEEGLLSIEDPIDKYIDLPKRDHYPSIRELLTHTSGYSSYYLEWPMVSNTLEGRNALSCISEDLLLKRLEKTSIPSKEHDFSYSNFAYGVLGQVLEEIYGKEYSPLVNSFLREDLGMKETEVSKMEGDLGKYWFWEEDDSYIPAGALVSNIEDMLKYCRYQLSDDKLAKASQEVLYDNKEVSPMYKALGFTADHVAYSWMVDRDKNRIWHNGATGNYNSYMGFNPKSQKAVVVLSNLGPDEGISATIVGVKTFDALEKGEKIP